MAYQRMGHAVMAGQDHHAIIQPGRGGKGVGQPCFPAILIQKIGMEDGALTERVFQHTVDGGAAGTGKMNKA